MAIINNESLLGIKIGHIEIIEICHKDSRGRCHFLCKCSCGHYMKPRKDFITKNLANPKVSCGCRNGISYDERLKLDNAKRRERYIANRINACAKARAYKLKSKYNITPEDYDQMFLAQCGKCAICSRDKTQLPETQPKLYVDHCHTTGKVRQLLCFACNSAIGLFREELRSLQEAINYLSKHNTSK